MIIVTHQIAGIIFRTESNVRIPRLQEKTFESFRIADIEPDVCHRIHKISPESLTLPVLPREERERFLHAATCSPGVSDSPLLRSPLVLDKLKDCIGRPAQTHVRLDLEQIIIRDFARRELDYFCMPEIEGFPAEHHIASNYPRIFSTFLPCFSAIMIHSAGIIRNKKSALFLAPDNGGKTTVVKLSDGEPILHDDQVALRLEGEVPNAYGTPMGRNTSGPCQARIGGFFFLDKALDFGLIKLQPLDLVQCIWAGHLGYTSVLPMNLKRQAFEILYNICQKTPVYLMRFPKHYIDWDAIDAAMEGKFAC